LIPSAACAIAVVTALGLSVPAAHAHISYTNRNLGVVASGGSTISGQTVSSSFGWADATDADWGDTHRTRVFRFTVGAPTSVQITAERVNLPIGNASGQQTGGHDVFLPALSLYAGLSHTSSPLAHDGAALSVEWLVSQFGSDQGGGVGGSGKEGSLNGLGDWSIGNSVNDWPLPSDPADTLRSLEFIGYAADGTAANFGSTPGLVGDGLADGSVMKTFVNLAPGDYSLFVGGANYDAQFSEMPTFGANGNAYPTYGIAVTVAAVPEPASFALVGTTGVAALAVRRRRVATIV
jgi:hypothetical protein